MRGLEHVPDYHRLHLPVTERVSAQEVVTIPHQLLLAGPEAMGLVVDAVTKVAERRDDVDLGVGRKEQRRRFAVGARPAWLADRYADASWLPLCGIPTIC